MDELLELHAAHGASWRRPGFHSGYNEMILNSAAHNRNLPHSVEAFFVPKGQAPHTNNLGYGYMIDVVRDHRRYLAEHGLSEEQVPMLELDAADWENPFKPWRG